MQRISVNFVPSAMAPALGFGSTIPIQQHIHFTFMRPVADLLKVIKNYDKDTVRTTIEHDVWIGANATILKGVHIGSGAIIGAGAVVTKDVKPYSIVVGNPSKLLKYRFDKEIIQSLVKAQWWHFDDSRIQDMVNKSVWFSIDSLIQYLKEHDLI